MSATSKTDRRTGRTTRMLVRVLEDALAATPGIVLGVTGGTHSHALNLRRAFLDLVRERGLNDALRPSSDPMRIRLADATVEFMGWDVADRRMAGAPQGSREFLDHAAAEVWRNARKDAK